MSHKMYIVIRHMCTDSLNCFLGEKQNPSGIGGGGGVDRGVQGSQICVKVNLHKAQLFLMSQSL